MVKRRVEKDRFEQSHEDQCHEMYMHLTVDC